MRHTKPQLLKTFDQINLKRLRRLFTESSDDTLELDKSATFLLRPLTKKFSFSANAKKGALTERYESFLAELATILSGSAFLA